jgi:hypothetical protein
VQSPAPGGGDDVESLHRQMIGSVLRSNRTDHRVVDPDQHGPALIQGALHIDDALPVNPRRRVQHPTVLGIRRLGDAVNTRRVFTGGTGDAHMICSPIPLHLRLTTIRPAVATIHPQCTTIVHPTSMPVSSLVG